MFTGKANLNGKKKDRARCRRCQAVTVKVRQNGGCLNEPACQRRAAKRRAAQVAHAAQVAAGREQKRLRRLGEADRQTRRG